MFSEIVREEKEKIKEVIPTYDMNLGKISTPSEIKKFQKLYNDAEGTLELKNNFNNYLTTIIPRIIA